MSNLSRLRRRSARSARQGARNLRYMNNGAYSTKPTTKKEKTFLEWTLIDSDIIYLMDIDDILPEYSNKDGTIHNNIFRNMRIKCDKIGLIYSQRKKLFMYIAINDNDSYQCHILFEEKDVYRLPNINKVDPNNINPNFQGTEKANRLMNSIFTEIVDITTNPIHVYKTSELFSK